MIQQDCDFVSSVHTKTAHGVFEVHFVVGFFFYVLQKWNGCGL